MKKLFFSKTVSLLIISILLLSFLPAGTVISDETFSPQGSVLCGKIEPGELLYPQGIFVDKTGNIFVVDQGNCRVQVFDKSGQFIRTFGGKDYLYMPSDVAILPNNNVIVLDSYNQATTGSGMAIFSQDGNFIKKINFFGENSSNSFNAPSGISVDSKDNVYISDTGSNRILIFDKDLKFLKEFGSNELNSPTGITVDDNKVYVSNFGNRRISIFSKDTNKLIDSIDKFTVKRNVGFFSTYYKTFTITPSPMGISIDNNGNLYFVDVKENLIISFDKEGKERFALDRFGTAEGQFIDPFGITTSSNIIYISDQKLGRILAFDTNGEYKFSIYSKTHQPYSVAEPSGVSEDSDGNLLICDQLTGRILKVNDDFSIKDLDFSESEIPFKDVKSHGEVGQLSFIFYPQKVQLDADGNIYVLDYGSIIGEVDEGGNFSTGTFSRILKFSPDLKYEKTIADVENFPFLNDFIIWNEHIFATALFNGVLKFDLDGKIIAQNTSLGMPEEIAKGKDSNLYIADSSNSLINVLDTNLKEIKKIGAFGNTEGKLAHPKGVAVSENGDIYVADTKNSRIVVFDKNGNYNFLFGSFGNENSEFVNPTRLFVSGKNVLVADPYASTVKVFDLSGNFKRYIASSKFFSGAFVSPTKVATNSSGMFAVLDGYMGRVILYKDGMYFESFNIFSDYSKRFSNFIKENELVIGDIALGEDGSVYVLNGNSSTVTRFYKNGQSTDVDSSLISLKPTAIAISNDDTFYAASASKEKVIYGKWVSGSLVREGEIDLSKLHPSSKNPIYPSSIFVKDNILYITDTLNFSVIAFNMTTKHLITIPINYPESEMSNTPEGVVADNSGNIYVCNSAFSRIEVYDNKGNFLYTFGKRGGPLGNASVLNDFPGAVRGYVGYFLYPSGIALSNNQLYIVDMLNRRIQMFDIGSIPLKTGTPCLAASTSKQGVILNWKDINENEDQGYTIFKEKDNSFEEIAEVTLDKNFYIDRDVKNGSTYSYFVRTIVNEEKLSFPTNIVSVNAEGVIKDITSPEITVSSPLNYSTVETNSIVLKGIATDDESGIDKVTVNGSEVFVASNGSFSKTVNLTKGTNTITIIATDIVGNKTTKTITVTYKKQTVITLKPDNSIMTVNGVSKEIDIGRGTKPVIIPEWGRTVVPIRAIVEALGGTISWEGTTKKVTINFEGTTIELWIDNPQAKVNGNMVYIDLNNHGVKPIIINDRTMLPLRFVAESLGCDVGWDNDTRTITIIYGG